MLALKTDPQANPKPLQFVLCDVQSEGDWLTRECPNVTITDT